MASDHRNTSLPSTSPKVTRQTISNDYVCSLRLQSIMEESRRLKPVQKQTEILKAK